MCFRWRAARSEKSLFLFFCCPMNCVQRLTSIVCLSNTFSHCFLQFSVAFIVSFKSIFQNLLKTEFRHHPAADGRSRLRVSVLKVLLWLSLHAATASSRFLQAPNWPRTSDEDERIKTLQKTFVLLALTLSECRHFDLLLFGDFQISGGDSGENMNTVCLQMQ